VHDVYTENKGVSVNGTHLFYQYWRGDEMSEHMQNYYGSLCTEMYEIREIRPEEYPLLDDFLYEAIYIPENVEAPPRDIIEQPDLQVYVADFGKKDDNALVAVQDETVVGAVWSRIMKDYGHVDDQIPSLAIALLKEYRGQGIGTALMRQMLLLLREKGYEKVLLSVQKANYAVKMYKAVGFRVLEDREEEYIMVCDLV